MKRITQAVCLLFMGILNSMLWLINVLLLKKEDGAQSDRQEVKLDYSSRMHLYLWRSGECLPFSTSKHNVRRMTEKAITIVWNNHITCSSVVQLFPFYASWHKYVSWHCYLFDQPTERRESSGKWMKTNLLCFLNNETCPWMTNLQ